MIRPVLDSNLTDYTADMI